MVFPWFSNFFPDLGIPSGTFWGTTPNRSNLNRTLPIFFYNILAVKLNWPPVMHFVALFLFKGVAALKCLDSTSLHPNAKSNKHMFFW